MDESARPFEAPTDAPVRRNATVLVCDDDRLVLLTLAAALRHAGFEVIEADNGDDAILLARQHRPDIALLDIRMDGKSGLDVASYLRDYVGTPFMFLSAFSDELFIRKAREFGALDYLVKPVDIDRVAPAVDEALRRAAQAQGGTEHVSVPPPAIPRDYASPSEDSTDAGRDAVAAPSPPATPAPRVARPSAVAGGNQAVAIGILMERFQLTRAGAAQRIAALAQRSGRTPEALSEELVRGLDTLNSAGSADH